TIVLDETGVKNLRLETVEAEEQSFEETIFALGRIEPIPSKRAVVSSRIPGRIVDLKVAPGDKITQGADVARLESRQPGDPPPSVLLKAPLGGLITEMQARLGEPVEPDKVLLEITDLSEVFAVARVPEHQAGVLAPGTRAHIRVAALPAETFEGELLRLGTEADRESGTLDAIFRLPNPNGTLRPGMRAEFSIVLSTREGVMAVPREAVQGDPTGRFIYIADYELKNAFVRVPVELGAQNDRFVEVKKGLLPGDQVVTHGAYALGFAGKGSVSLKEALDAAHGHPHNEDGSEMSKEQIAASGSGHGQHGHDEHGWTMLTTFFAATSALLFVLLVTSTLLRRRTSAA
ncbi:MAG: efflux RND transporter periplasmic adaptor subunit, partial [Verrucomicrobiaceae bacterium]